MNRDRLLADLIARMEPLFAKSRVALTIADLDREDTPLVAVNDRFTRITGYAADEVIGRNCRFLQPVGGAGPVRQAMRTFIADPDSTEGRFLVPNLRRNGQPFLNFVYLAKLSREGRPALILGSQFAVEAAGRRAVLYDRALREDLDKLRTLFEESDWALMGSASAIASSLALLARHRLEAEA